MKSRYCVKCEAMFKYDCSCPNNLRMAVIKKEFEKMRDSKIKMAQEALRTLSVKTQIL